MPKPKLCLRTDCHEHDHDRTWQRAAPAPRPVYAAADLRRRPTAA